MPPVTRTFRAGDTLFNEGDPSTSIFIIKKGVVSIRKRNGTTTFEVAKVNINEVIGELSFFDREPRSATAIAVIEVEALELPFEAMEKIYADIPDYLKTIIAAMAQRLRKANDQIRTIMHKNRLT